MMVWSLPEAWILWSLETKKQTEKGRNIPTDYNIAHNLDVADVAHKISNEYLWLSEHFWI